MKINLKIGQPVVIISDKYEYNDLISVYDDYYYLGNGVIGRMNLPFRHNQPFFNPAFNIFEEDWINYIIPYNDYKTFEYKIYSNYKNYPKENVNDLDTLDNCLYAKENYGWWNSEQIELIKSFHI